MSLRVVNLTNVGSEVLARDESPVPPSERSQPHRRISHQEDGVPEPLPPEEPLEDDFDDDENPSELRGKSLGIFGPENPFRKACAVVLKLPGTEPVILLCILLSVVIMTLQTAPNVYSYPRPAKGYFHSWEDYALFGLFVAFTIEVLARIVVTGLFINPPLPKVASSPGPIDVKTPALGASTGAAAYPPAPPQTHELGFRTLREANSTTSLVDRKSTKQKPLRPLPRETKLAPALATHTAHVATGLSAHTPFVQSIKRQRTTYQHAFLRHSWNRLDFVAIVSFWISFGLSVAGIEASHNVYIFRALSVLRATRLLSITAGTTTILHSLKGAAPQLVKVALFVAFAMLMFSIIGVQSFTGSYRRSCVWTDPAGQYQNVSLVQMCGGFHDSVTGDTTAYIVKRTGLPSPEGSKGFICPAPSEGQNPTAGAYSFDNVVAALLQVVIVSSANTWTVIMYNMMDADFFVSCLYFIVCLIVLNYWLINMFVAVITNTFGSIMDNTQHSAFTSKTIGPIDALKSTLAAAPRLNQGPKFLRKAYKATRLIWVAAIVADIGFQASRRFDMTAGQDTMLRNVELYFTLAFDVEVLIRAVAALPEWRTLWEPENAADIALAILTSVIQIPVIRDSDAYPWLTVFQILRFYRVILAIPRMRRLLVRVLGTFTGLVNMVIFMLIMTFLAALMAAQMFRGLIPYDAGGDAMNFYQIFNSFLAMYQILSSENWTTPLETVLTNEIGLVQTVIAAAFLSGWMLFSFFILISMFIAVINENFAIAEEEKHKQQMQMYIDQNAPETGAQNWVRRVNPYNYLAARPKAVSVENMPSTLVLPMKKAVVKEYMQADMREKEHSESLSFSPARVLNVFRGGEKRESHPLADMSSPTSAAAPRTGYAAELFPVIESTTSDDRQGALGEQRAQQADFITAHPSYDRSLWIFSQKNLLRRFCQRVVEPAYGGERIKGRKAVRVEKLAFQVLLFAAIIGSIAIAGYATPLYRRNYFLLHGQVRWTWFNVTEISLGFIFVVEFLIKVIADGFIFAPNAYLLSIWNALDFFVLVTLVINVITALVAPGGISRFTRALKAFRALRLIGLSPQIRSTFYNVLIVGAGKILDASILALLYIIPFAVWGLNIFNGRLYFCNDSSVATKAECAGEFLNTVTYISGASSNVTDNWSYMAPRIWTNPYVWTFDTFRGSLLVLFEIISLEGWIGVMESVMQITGLDLQPQLDASQFNGLFLVIYNLIGAVFILTLFVSVIIENFTRRSGTSLLTTEQRQWIDLRKLILRQRPAKRPKVVPTSSFRRWCFDRANAKKGWWARGMTVLYCLQVLTLMTQAESNPVGADQIRNYIYIGFAFFFFVDVFVRLVGLGWSSFIQNGWNVFDIVVATGIFATTVPILIGVSSLAATELQKLFVVCIALKLVQKNDALNELFKTAAASLPDIGNIFALWIILFFVWAIFFVEVFGLTRWSVYETRNMNYTSFWQAMVMLALASTGEGWNGYMHDYTLEFPQCTANDNFLLSDCGSAGWAYALFSTWNVLSMYLMSNLILGAVVENFSYVFQIYGKVQTINREQMRGYKRVWQQFDPDRTGFMQKKDIVPFLGQLTGVFEVKIFRAERQLPALWKAAIVGPDDGNPRTFAATLTHPEGRSVDLARLGRALGATDFKEVTKRKKRYNSVYHEAMLDAEENAKGIPFRSMLLLLAHHCLVQDDRALQLEESLERREKIQKVTDRVNADHVRSLLKTTVLRRKYLANREHQRQQTARVPAIIVDSAPRLSGAGGLRIDIDESGTPPGSPLGSPTHSRYTLTPGSVESGDDDDSYFDRSAGSASFGSPSGRSQRHSITAEDGEDFVNQAVAKWSGAFAQDEEEF
ncbi:hypothetical protein RQP46_005971 [Phenoliferia psychrophenolica]